DPRPRRPRPEARLRRPRRRLEQRAARLPLRHAERRPAHVLSFQPGLPRGAAAARAFGPLMGRTSMRWFVWLIAFAVAAVPLAHADETDLGTALLLYASFDEAVAADRAGGERALRTRYNHPTEKGKFVFDKGYPEKAFRIARGKGVSGGALEAVDVLPR